MNTLVYIVGFITLVCLSAVYGGEICTKDQHIVSSIDCNGMPMYPKLKGPCLLKKGTNATLVVKFVPDVAVEKLKAVCHGIIGGIPIPFSGIDTDGCHGMTPACPLQAKKKETYTTSIFVNTKYPSLKVIIRWQLQDQDSNDVMCLQIPAELTN